ncbi:MAG: hypothetical protein U9P71_03380 [Campylobacterota bacterium]|nr:hypothetical protein [Campylobacterota bacterium]
MEEKDAEKLQKELQKYIDGSSEFISYYEQMKKITLWLEEKKS